MKHLSVLFLILTLIAMMGCGDKQTEQAAVENAGDDHAQAPAAMPTDDGLTGPVLETMDSGGYTYVLIETSAGQKWAAGPITAVKVGESVNLARPMLMKNFVSKSLGREFDEILFVGEIHTADTMHAPAKEPDVSAAHANMTVAKSDMDFSDVKPADGGVTIKEVYERMNELAGKSVTVNAKVVKFTPNIMSRNWVHVQDGTGAAGTNDLTVTTDAMVKVGDLVLLQGKLAVDKDFGAGYVYKVILEETKVMVQ